MKKVKLPILVTVFAVLPCSSLFSQDNEQLIKNYISQNKIREYKKSDLTNFIIENIDNSKSLNGSVVKFQQIYKGLPVFSSVGTVLVKDNKVVYYTDNFVKDYKTSASNFVGINKITALQKIANDLGNSDISNFSILDFFDKDSNTVQFAKQRLVYAHDKNGNLRLAYEYILKEPKSSNYWNVLVDANNAEIIMKNNLTLYCNVPKDSYASDVSIIDSDDVKNQLINKENPQVKSPLLSPDNASYNVFAHPVEAPSFGSRTVVSNPWILASSPEGWHSDGVNHYTTARGNNVFAFLDNGTNPQFSPDGGASRNFNFPFDTNQSTSFNRDAAVVNLFYVSNKVHDIFYRFGFTESARNFQTNNFGNGGLDNDAVYTLAQDPSGMNNSAFLPTPDGTTPGLTMYLWTTISRLFFYNSPSSAVIREPGASAATFGPVLNSTGVTGDIKAAAIMNGCSSLPVGSLTGKIGLIENEDCDYTTKVKNAQNAGAVAVIVYNLPTSIADEMTGTDSTITIPSVLIENSEGEYIKNQLSNSTTVNVTLKKDPVMHFDGSFDNGIIIHEYGHGISNRLTGSGYNCLDSSVSAEQMGEGWSDFFALMLTNKTGDNASVPRGMFTYVLGQPVTGKGQRLAKYSPDFAINNYKYGNTNGMDTEHSIGFIWATMLWDLHWQYVNKYGYSSDVTANTTNGSSRVLQLVIDALKLQACNPTFVDGRNAILAADMATTGGADKCMIWNTFAKRGLGVNASAGSKTDINDQVEDFTIPTECNVLATNEVNEIKNTISIYPNPAKNEFFINFPSNILGKVNIEIYDMSGKLVSSEDKISPDAKKAISTDKLIDGTYMVKVKGLAFDATSKIIIKK